jgi:RNA polymerase sigma factor (sigma-70 family)
VDRTLVEQAQRGDREAFQELAFAISDRLFGLAHRILRDFDAAGDALQMALVRIWRDLPSLRDPDKFEAWAHRALVHACHDQIRSDRRAMAKLRVLHVDTVAADLTDQVNDREQLERAFGRLSAEHRAVILLQYYRDLSLPEIADLLQLPIGTVRSRLHYAKRVLRAAVEADARTSMTARLG